VENYLAKIWPNFSQIGRVAVDFELKTYVSLAKAFFWRKKENTFFCGDLPEITPK